MNPINLTTNLLLLNSVHTMYEMSFVLVEIKKNYYEE